MVRREVYLPWEEERYTTHGEKRGIPPMGGERRRYTYHGRREEEVYLPWCICPPYPPWCICPPCYPGYTYHTTVLGVTAVLYCTAGQ